MDFNDFLNERRITIKRRYTENHPAIKAGQSARVRNKILEAIADGSITTEEFDKIVSELSNDSKRWVKRNSKYFSVSEEGISLSKFGKRILNNITVNEAYDGNMSDFKYEFPQVFVDVTGNSEKAIKKMTKKGKGYEVRTSIYMSEPEMQKVADEMGLELVSFKKDSSIAITVYESVVTEATTKNPEVWVPGGFDKAISKIPNSKITRKLVLKLADKHDVDPSEAIPYVEFGWDLDLSENKNTNMKNTFIYESFTEFVSSINEGKRENGKVVTAWKKMKVTDLNSIAKVYADAMEDANFHAEIGTSRAIGSASKAKKNDYDASDISAAAGWNGYAIANGTVDFLRSIGEEAAADKLLKAITKFDLNESIINESFKSSKLANLLNLGNSIGYHKGYKGALAKAFYGLSKIKMDQIEDLDLLDYDAQAAYKEFRNAKDHVVFFIVDNEKKNDYADSRSMGDTVYPGIIGMSRANNFVSPEIGGNKEYRGYGASGIYNVKRAAELADRAIVINMLEVRDLRGNGAAQQRDRVEARSGAIAFQSDRDFKKSNMLRYKEILATKASKLPLDAMVEGAINDLTKHISDAMKSGEMTKYGEIKIGEDKKGRDIKLTDAANIMSSILSDYERYVRYVADAEKDKENGWGSSFYEKESKQYAKSLSDRIKKVKDMDYAW